VSRILAKVLVRRHLSLLILAVLCIACRLYGAEPSSAMHVQKVTGSIPFRLHQGYVIAVQGSIGGRRNLNFIVETGASPTVIDAKLARELGIVGKATSLALPNGKIPVLKAELPSLNIGPLHRTDQKVIIGDLATLRSHLGIPIDGLIGLDVLGQSSFTIDYQHKEIVFGVSEEANSIPYEADASLVLVKLLSGGKALRVLVDTGTPGLLLFRSSVDHRLSGVKFLGGEDMRNMGGWLRVDRVAIDDLGFGEKKLGTTSARVADAPSNWAEIFDGVLGPSSLYLRRLSFDVEHHMLGWTQ